MARKHLTPKRHLGREIRESTLDVTRRLAKAVAAAEDGKGVSPPKLSAIAEAGAAEASLIEEMATIAGAEILFDEDREGPITSLAIILIPDENRQNRRVAALAATFGFVAHLSKRKKIAIAVPQGYVTDFASIPGFAQWMISPFGKHSEAAVVHDWLYTLGTKGDRKGRKLADRTFKRALKIVGVGWFRRNIMYLAVRMGGGSGYGLESDYDFRDLERLKRRDPLPDRKAFGITWKEMDIPKPQKGKKKSAPPPSPAPAMTEAEAKRDAQETMVATKTE